MAQEIPELCSTMWIQVDHQQSLVYGFTDSKIQGIKNILIKCLMDHTNPLMAMLELRKNISR